MKRTVINVCCALMLLSSSTALVFPESSLSPIAFVIGFFSMTIYSIALFIEDDET
ncbi:hypothetical protein [Bacillus salacetis]|uniref:hypothetical protein n=1 Tax=Bacillus salacetis TaxID=2315464 RepID=UPI001443A52C|nr:hypothetical protein [Bacillus salacetis]